MGELPSPSAASLNSISHSFNSTEAISKRRKRTSEQTAKVALQEQLPNEPKEEEETLEEAASVKREPVRRSLRKRKSAEGVAKEDTVPEKETKKGENEDEPKKRRRSKSKNESANPPDDWEKVWEGITEMRKNRDAPVDTMGCEVLAEDAEPKVQRYQTLISLMLSSQTKDQQTAAAMRKLQKHGLTVENILNTPESELDGLISNVGFHNNKAKFIKRTTEMLHEEYDDDIPPDYKGLLKLPGVGPKMAHLTLQCAWHKTEGIGVDVHVHRISNRLGWVRETKNPEATRKELEEWLPREHWNQINLLLVGLGQTICTPRNPKCDECKVKDLCPEGSRSQVKPNKAGKGRRRASRKAKEPAEEEAAIESDEDYRP